ncbi:MAG: hypothetical protein K8T91_03370 [Planctomycetes bacterium]|nr:hypothetical protein [Planctomycetota bacterium]
MLRFLTLSLLAMGMAWAASPTQADIFKLKSGGEIRGELANAEESPREKYIVRPYAGGELTLPAAVVSQVVHQRSVDVEYEKAKVKMADTAEEHWKMAEWCRDKKLDGNRETHLQRIIELEPDHAAARLRLGYTRVGERWLTLEERMKEEGKIKHGNRWVLAQELELIKQREADKKSQGDWHAKLSLWRKWLDGDKAGAARREILDIHDKAADDPLITKLKREKDPRVRELYAEALSNIGTPAAVKTIVEYSIGDPNRSFREFCRDLIEKHKPAGALPLFVKGLSDKDNAVVNRAARGLGRLGDQAAVRPLIDALVTKHKYIINQGGGAGSISPTFSRDANGNGGAGLSSGGGPKIVIRSLHNDEVLAALVKLTGQDFDFDVNGWKSWFAANKQEKQPAANARRD